MFSDWMVLKGDHVFSNFALECDSCWMQSWVVFFHLRHDANGFTVLIDLFILL